MDYWTAEQQPCPYLEWVDLGAGPCALKNRRDCDSKPDKCMLYHIQEYHKGELK